MARPKSVINSVDLARAVKAMKSAGLTINYTQIEPNGTVTFNHTPELSPAMPISADEALTKWEDGRASARHS